MKLTRYSDYALRICLYLSSQTERLVPISEIVEAHEIPRSNVMKLAMDLVSAGFLESVRGRSGGLRLARAPAEILLGDILRRTEGEQPLVDCSECVLAPSCGLICILDSARRAFYDSLDAHSLGDVLARNPSAYGPPSSS
ncbi:Rrf2 family transcriptional regulator [Tropicimonas sp. TH_r6]|uniref:RrF2 family transcriptional regulator n=1 Tax=Tropicimonas sp. TH_r6 TaxID=3082085 RepID=UPI00295473D8|nr:Rrf2 family transcriptional regulator [Tropicimonas sp. TH_r6]MDV7141237.1 Rrf2 family transcriptional regulator [Tropicimonas sp. TH_r6]